MREQWARTHGKLTFTYLLFSASAEPAADAVFA
jgi:hypothetical protein